MLSVTGGASTNAYGGNGIGGISFGGSSGSVIIFATGKVTITGGDGQGTTSDGVDIGGGLGTTDGGNGQGIRPVSGQENTYTVWGNLTLPCDITIPQGATVTIPDGASLTVPSGTKLTNNGTISVQGGAFSGEVSGTQPIAAAGYTINYADETITASNGYELSATNTETAEESQTLNLTPGEDVYIRLAELEGASWVTVDIPARPAAPAVTATIDYFGEKLSFPSDVTETTLEYALSQSNPNWKDVPSGAALSEMEWDGNAEKSYYFRTGATDSAFASSATTTSITAPARPAAPNDLNLMDYTDVSVTYYVGEGVQCRLGNEGA